MKSLFLHFLFWLCNYHWGGYHWGIREWNEDVKCGWNWPNGLRSRDNWLLSFGKMERGQPDCIPRLNWCWDALLVAFHGRTRVSVYFHLLPRAVPHIACLLMRRVQLWTHLTVNSIFFVHFVTLTLLYRIKMFNNEFGGIKMSNVWPNTFCTTWEIVFFFFFHFIEWNNF